MQLLYFWVMVLRGIFKMQYILSSEEMDDIKAKLEMLDHIRDINELQRICTLLADTYVLTEGWHKGQVWGCMLTAEKNGDEWYCDDCPAKKVCPYPYKSWSQ
jgi:hypothetical protein